MLGVFLVSLLLAAKTGNGPSLVSDRIPCILVPRELG